MDGYFGTEIDGFNVETFGDAMEAVHNGEAEYGVLPIENSSTGSVNDVYDLLSAYDNHIVGEHMVKIEHALLGLPGSRLEDVHTVYSHPQGLMQCSRFLDEHRDWQQVSLQNTAASAKECWMTATRPGGYCQPSGGKKFWSDCSERKIK